MSMDIDYSKLSNTDLIIKILEFVCKRPSIGVSESLINSELFPGLELKKIKELINEIKLDKNIPVLVNEINQVQSLKYLNDLDEYVKNIKKMTKKEKLHRILEFICTENDRTRKSGFDSGEIAKAFTPEMDIYEVNTLCKILLDNGDVKDCTSKDQSAVRMVAILVVRATHDAYHTRKYLEDDEPFTFPFQQNISGTNLIVGDISGNVKQEANTTANTETIEKPKWIRTLYWVVGILVGLSILITFFITVFKK
jgi:hypothetical protein